MESSAFKLLGNAPMRFKKTIFLTMFTLLVMAGCTRLYNNTELSTGHIAPLVKKIQPAIVTVVAYDVNRKVSNLGSGFFIDKKGHLITNYHVLKGSYAADVKHTMERSIPSSWLCLKTNPQI